MVADDIKIYLRAETKAAVAAMRKAQKQTDSLSGTLGSLAKTAVKTFGAYAAAAVSVKAVVRTIKESVSVYGVQIAAEQGLAAALRATGESASYLMPQLEAAAAGIQAVTTYGDEAVLGLMQMAKSQGVATSQLEQAAKAAIGLTEAYGGGMQDNIRKVARAMQGDYTALQELIPALRTATTESEKQAIVQKALADGFDVAKAKANNGVAAMTQLTNAVGDYKETIGRAVAEGMKPFTQWLTNIVSGAAAARDKLLDVKEVLDAYEKSGGKVSAEGEQRKLQVTAALALEQERLNDLMGDYGITSIADAQHLDRAAQSILAQQKDKVDLLQSELDLVKMADAYRLRGLAYNEEGNRLQAIANKYNQLNLDALERYKELQFAALTPQEQKVQKLQEEIDKWAAVRAAAKEAGQDYQSIQLLLTQLVNERNAAANEDGVTNELNKNSQEMLAILKERSDRRIELTRKNAIMIAEIEAERIAETERLERESMERRKDMMFQLASYTGQMMNTMSSIVSNMYDQQIQAAEGNEEKQKKLRREQSLAQRKWAIYEATLSAAAAVAKTMTSVAYPFNVPLAAAQAALGIGQIAKIQSQPIPAYAKGGEFVTNGPQMIMVGDNPGGRERVRIDPQNDNRSSSGVVINFAGNVYGPGGAEKFANYIVQAVKRGQRSGRVEAWV